MKLNRLKIAFYLILFFLMFFYLISGPRPIMVFSQTESPAEASSATSTLYHVILTGQSLSLGADGQPPLSLTQPFQNLMLQDEILVPLVEEKTESPASALGNTISALTPENKFQCIITRNGRSGASYQNLKKSTGPYQESLREMSVVKKAAEILGQTYRVTALAVIHGESDVSIAENKYATKNKYKTNLLEWINDYNQDVKNIIGQEETFPMFTDQLSSFTALGYKSSVVPLAQLAAAEENPDKIYLVGPKYFLDYSPSDGIHLTNKSYRWLGEYYGKVIKKVVVDKEDWKPLSPEKITIIENEIFVKFHVPEPPLVFDTESVLPQKNSGFEFSETESSDPPTISQVEIFSKDTVRIYLSAKPLGQNQTLRYAYTGTVGSFAGAKQPGSARGNLRDSDATPSLYGNKLYNWAVQFEKPIVAEITASTSPVAMVETPKESRPLTPGETLQIIAKAKISEAPKTKQEAPTPLTSVAPTDQPPAAPEDRIQEISASAGNKSSSLLSFLNSQKIILVLSLIIIFALLGFYLKKFS